MSVSQQENIPVIEGIYDPLSQRRDGTITPCAPVMITGYNLLYWPKEQVEFCLSPVEDSEQLIPVLEIHKHTEKRLIVTIPDVEKGAYRLVLRVIENEDERRYYFPVIWQVKNLTLMEIYGDRPKFYSLGT